MGKSCVPAIESRSCISSVGLVKRLAWRLGFHQSWVKFMTPHKLLTKNTGSLIRDSNKISKYMQVIKNECQVRVELYRTSSWPHNSLLWVLIVASKNLATKLKSVHMPNFSVYRWISVRKILANSPRFAKFVNFATIKIFPHTVF